jgi:hypothetical protein
MLRLSTEHANRSILNETWFIQERLQSGTPAAIVILTLCH